RLRLCLTAKQRPSRARRLSWPKPAICRRFVSALIGLRYHADRRLEIDNGARHSEVVQSDQELWIHSAAGRRQDVFVHMPAVERAGLSTLNEGQHIEYEIEENRGKTSAVNLKVK